VFTVIIVVSEIKFEELRVIKAEVILSAYLRLHPERVHCELDSTNKLEVCG